MKFPQIIDCYNHERHCECAPVCLSFYWISGSCLRRLVTFWLYSSSLSSLSVASSSFDMICWWCRIFEWADNGGSCCWCDWFLLLDVVNTTGWSSNCWSCWMPKPDLSDDVEIYSQWKIQTRTENVGLLFLVDFGELCWIENGLTITPWSMGAFDTMTAFGELALMYESLKCDKLFES